MIILDGLYQNSDQPRLKINVKKFTV